MTNEYVTLQLPNRYETAAGFSHMTSRFPRDFVTLIDSNKLILQCLMLVREEKRDFDQNQKDFKNQIERLFK